ncbi:hypothetical protein [Methylobacter tundripaludum]|uniref:hypothetical protein n=1 Tax=Methylobacter tundripaludum TaxID=173365 RepID=UPI0004846790|nr:hypothetical protein [Methylobacter tundripaludum]
MLIRLKERNCNDSSRLKAGTSSEAADKMADNIYSMMEDVDRLADEVYKIAEGICSTADDGLPQPLLTS